VLKIDFWLLFLGRLSTIVEVGGQRHRIQNKTDYFRLLKSKVLNNPKKFTNRTEFENLNNFVTFMPFNIKLIKQSLYQFND